MGVNDRARDAKDAKAMAREGKRLRRSTSVPATGRADWTEVDGGLVVKAVAALAKHGAAITLACTRDGGAFAITIYEGTEHFKEYYKPDDDMDAVFRGMIEDYENG